MSEVINIYQEVTEDGLAEVKELENGMKIISLINPTNEYMLANSIVQAPQPNINDYLLDLDYRMSMFELGLGLGGL
ncbi:hypothetical protein [Desulfosporosinus hippei]|uniref:Uncharacterized protein n=1 Tax=Desulfosporosinus hippei DSM 8344 TaxID=1121419 RepID=A0A1G7UJF6_9FIRM|nr:hypothetical protein [Desulfosporosinus hippei]SDG47381.1 hypothetical protein SAMN05443529_103156 [Desulfosporosinus hippei DSM 8344]